MTVHWRKPFLVIDFVAPFAFGEALLFSLNPWGMLGVVVHKQMKKAEKQSRTNTEQNPGKTRDADVDFSQSWSRTFQNNQPAFGYERSSFHSWHLPTLACICYNWYVLVGDWWIMHGRVQLRLQLLTAHAALPKGPQKVVRAPPNGCHTTISLDDFMSKVATALNKTPQVRSKFPCATWRILSGFGKVHDCFER